MKIIKYSIILLSIFALFVACEKDDICASSTDTTPVLKIEFFNNTNKTAKKNVVELAFFGIDDAGNIMPNGTLVGTASALSLPLKTTQDRTQFVLYQNFKINNNGTPNDTSDDYIEGNPDIITLNYTRRNIYVSRACGYKTVFENITLTIESDSNNWILGHNVISANQNLEDDSKVFFYLYH